MDGKIIKFKDLSESREVVEHKIPHFMLWFFYFILVMLIVLLIWSYFGEKEIVVQSSGVVRTENIQIVTPIVSGTISEIYYQEGDHVNKGDLIFTLNSTSIDMDVLNYTNALEGYQDDLALEELYLQSIEQNENLLDLSIVSQITKYYEFEMYIDQYNSAEDQTKFKNETVASITQSIDQKNQTILQYQNEINKLQAQLQNYQIFAEFDGVVHFTQEVKQNSSVQAGYELIRIYEDTEDKFEIQLYVPNSEIAKIEVGQNVRVEIPALSPSEYGYASAEVTSIETDSRYDQSSGQSFYVVTAVLDDLSLNDEDILIGMQVQGRLIVDEQNYLYWAIEKLELWIFE